MNSFFGAWTATQLAALEEEELYESAHFEPVLARNAELLSVNLGLSGKTIATFALERHQHNEFEPGMALECIPAPGSTPAAAAGVPGMVVSSEPLKVSLAAFAPHSAASRGYYTLKQTPDSSSFRKMREALAATPADSKWARLLFAQPVPAPRLQVPPAAELHWRNAGLNASQRAAVAGAASSLDVFAIHGPPGTGKSAVLVETVLQLVRAAERKVLVCAPSNVAVDNVLLRVVAAAAAAGEEVRCLRLGHVSRVDPGLASYCLESAVWDSDGGRLLHGARRELGEARAQGRWAEAGALRREIKARERKLLAEAVARADVVFSTVVGAHKLRKLLPTGKGRGFTLVVDEAAQASAASAFVALQWAEALVVAGDPRQLAPTVKSPLAAARGLAASLMQLVAARFGARLLEVQYRMHRSIMAWVSLASYDGKLVAHESVAGARLALKLGAEAEEEAALVQAPLAFIDTAGCGMQEEAGEGARLLCNPGEAALAVAHVRRLLRLAPALSASGVAVIAPYRAQVELLRVLLDAAGLADVRAGTVDGFQGQEREAVVFSCTRSNDARAVGFLNDARRVNVALSRARKHVCVIGDARTLGADAFMKGLLEHLEEFAEVRSAGELAAPGEEEEARRSLPPVALAASSRKAHGSKPSKPAQPDRAPPKTDGLAAGKPTPVYAAAVPLDAGQPSAGFEVLAEEEEEEVAEASPADVAVTASKKTKKKKGKPGPAPDAAAAEEEDAFLDLALSAARRCASAKGCKESVAVTGFNCSLCRLRFCAAHRLPEVHGCGHEARAKARSQPGKPALRPSERAQLVKKLDRKIAGQEHARAAGGKA